MNSVELIQHESKYDLIWIDGDHSYPTAAIDISNAVRLLTKNGIDLCDDVYLYSTALGKNSRSVATIETMRSIKDSNLINFELVKKRLGYFFNSPKSFQKYLGVITLKDS